MTHETPLMSLLEQLVHTTAEAPGDPWTMRALASVVADLERAAGAGLGPTEHDSLVMLQRRMGRAHRLLVADPGAASLERVRLHLQALRQEAPAPGIVPAGDPAGPTLAHAC